MFACGVPTFAYRWLLAIRLYVASSLPCEQPSRANVMSPSIRPGYAWSWESRRHTAGASRPSPQPDPRAWMSSMGPLTLRAVQGRSFFRPAHQQDNLDALSATDTGAPLIWHVSQLVAHLVGGTPMVTRSGAPIYSCHSGSGRVTERWSSCMPPWAIRLWAVQIFRVNGTAWYIHYAVRASRQRTSTV